MRISAASFALFMSVTLFSQEVKTVNTKIDQVTVFFSGAQMVRNGATAVNAGVTKVIFSDLPFSMDPQSIQLKGTGGTTLLSVNHQYNYLNQQKKSEEVKALQAQKEELQDKYNVENNMFEVYHAEEEMLKKNQDIKGQDNGISIVDLKSAVDYFRTRLTDIRMKKLEQQKKIKKLLEEIAKIDSQIGQLNAFMSNPTSEVVAMVSSKITVNATFNLTYYAPGAGWTPAYDMRVESTSSPVHLSFKANVFQTTGEKWNDVKLWLSTANPSFNGTKPHIYPWYLSAYVPTPKINKMEISKRKAFAAPSAAMRVEAESDASLEELQAPMQFAASEQQQQTTSMIYKISDPYDITGDGKSYGVMINEMDVPASYEYYCAPKLDKDAFLLAHITGWQDYNLLTGDANLYFEGTYVGKSLLDATSTLDTLDFSLGRDKSIIVDRKSEKDLSSKSIMGNKRKVSKSWAIQIRNNKKSAIDIVIEDQFPISQNNEIKVDQIDYKGAELNKVTGILTWRLKVDPGQTQKTGFKYSVEFPKEMNVIVE